MTKILLDISIDRRCRQSDLDVRQHSLLQIARAVQRMGVETLAQFSSELAHASIHTGDKNWNSMIFVRFGAKERRHQRQLEKLALKN